jgi:hypothetical protein
MFSIQPVLRRSKECARGDAKIAKGGASPIDVAFGY